MPAPDPADFPEDPIRPHTYDGIQEYDKRLPNWWLFTFYGAIVFSFVYWLYFHDSGVGLTSHQTLARDLAALEEARLASAMGELDDGRLWAMSRDPKYTDSGRSIYQANCVACHLTSLRGKEESPLAVGPSLVDGDWIHGGRPVDVRRTITQGVIAKGMQAWGPVLGDRKILDVVAYVMSHHQPPEGVPAGVEAGL